MKTKNAIFIACTILGGISAAFSSCVSAQGQEGKVTLRLSTYVNKLDQRYEWLKRYADTVQEKTNGRVSIKIFPSGVLQGFNQSLEAIQGGVSDVGPFVGGAIDKRQLPCAELTQAMPLDVNWSKIIDLDKAYDNILDQEYEKAGLKILFSMNGSDQEWWFRKPVVDFGNLSGKLVRSPGGVVTHVIEELGGKAVFIAPKELFGAAERGVVDGVDMGTATFSAWKLWPVMPYMVRANLFYNNIVYAINKAKFDALKSQDQKAMLEAGWEVAQWATPRYNAWVEKMVGEAVMNVPGVSVMGIPTAKRLKLIARLAKGWNDRMDKVCGVDMAKRLQTVFKKYEK